MNTQTKIAFIGNSEGPAKLLEIFRKMTPERSGVWGNLEGVSSYEEADYFVVIDYMPCDLKGKIDNAKCIYIGAHPETMQAYRDLSNIKAFKTIDIAHTNGFCEWWLNLDYTYLSNLQPPVKTNRLCCIMSDADSQFYHRSRREHLSRFVDTIPENLDFSLYGRIVPFTDKMKTFYRGPCGSYDPRGAATAEGNDHMSGKEEVLRSHRFALEYDCTGEHYISERVFDDLLMWAMPVYWGGKGVEKYLPKESFIPLYIEGNGSDFLDYLNPELYTECLPAITKARDILLNELQLWPVVHKAIFGTSI